MSLGKRMANRRRAKSGGSQMGSSSWGGGGGGGGRMSPHKSFGSMDSNGARKGAGTVAGAGELMTPHNGPGKAAMGYAGMDKAMYPNRPTPPGTPPKGMSVYEQGSGSSKSRT